MAGTYIPVVLDTDLERTLARDIQAALAEVTGTEEVADAVRPFVDGQQAGGTGAIQVLVDPSTGEPFCNVALAGPEDVLQAVEAAGRAYPLWRSTAYEERGSLLRRLSVLIRHHADRLAEIIAHEQGKPKHEALAMEILPALDHLKFIIFHAERFHAGLAVEPRHPYYAHKRAHYLYDAIGVVALVTPRAMPFATPLIQVAAALAMGNAVVLKPSEHTPLSGIEIGRLCAEAGFPRGIVNVVPAVPEDTLHLVAHPRIDKVFVTGGLETGQSVMATAGCSPRPVVLSLGGKHPTIVAGDADIERAARGIVWGAFANCGQSCGSVERVYVEERVATKFIERALHHVQQLQVGSAVDDGIDMGPMQSEADRTRVHQQVQDAVNQGAQCMHGGEIPHGPGSFYPPTILTDVPNECRLMQEETLGPVLPIVVVESLERAILLANESQYALAASGWTSSSHQAERMMVGLQAGVVTINDLLYSYGEPSATWSGYRRSGIGQNHGTPGLREMSRQRFVSFDANSLEAPAYSYPYNDDAEEMVQNSIQHLHGTGKMARFKAWWRLIRNERFRRRVDLRTLIFSRKRQLR